MSSKTPLQTGVLVSLKAESIYQDSLAEVSLESQSLFSIKVSGEIVKLATGKYDKSNSAIIKADKNEDKYFIRLVLLKWFEERIVSKEEQENIIDRHDAHNRHGMRFYPFVSSSITSQLTIIGNHVDKVLIELPDQFRLIWKAAKIINPNKFDSELNHSMGLPNQVFIFVWGQEENTPGTYNFDVPVRLGGKEMMRIINFPIYYAILALVTVWAASFATNPSVLVAAILGSWTFLLRRLDVSDLPQINTLLTQLFMAIGVLITIWGGIWKMVVSFILPVKFPSIFNAPTFVKKLGIEETLKGQADYWIAGVILFFVFPILFCIIWVLRKVGNFNRTGLLSGFVSKYWSKKIKKAQQKQTDAAKSIKKEKIDA